VEVAFVGPYYISSKAVLTKEKSVVAGTSMKRFNDSRFRFTALKGSTSQKFVEENFPEAQLIPAEGYPEAVRLLLDDKVHALLADYPICAVTLMRHPEAGFYSDILKLTYEPLGIAVPANDPHLINWLENTLGNLEGDGTLKAIEEYWFSDLSWFSRIP
jgi:polar amino acid transport system substrate-binding protein